MADIKLSACGFALTLIPETAPSSMDFEGRVDLTSLIMPSFQRPATFPLDDLARLRDWVEAHITRLIEEQPSSLESHAWIPMDFSLSIRCLSGGGSYNQEEVEGSFAIQIFVAMGEDPATGITIYAGLQGEVGIEEALTFCREITEYVSRSTS